MNINANINGLYLYIGFFSLTIILDYFIINNYLGSRIKSIYISKRNSSYFYISTFLFIVFLIVFSVCFNLTLFDINYDNINDVFSKIVNKDIGVSTNIGTNSTVNINNPKFNVSLSDRGINNIATALLSAGGATAGLKTAQFIGGPPAIKLLIGLGTMAIVQAGTSIMYKVLNQSDKNNDLTNNQVNNLIFPRNNNTKDNTLNDYPLSLLEYVDILLYAALLFLIVIFNLYLASYFHDKDYNKYLPKNKLGNILKKLINR